MRAPSAAELGIPLHRVSFAEQYRARVFDYFLTEYRAGRTPNPDVLCNREIKFGICLDYAARLGAQRFATGHYARLEHGPAGPVLLKARDRRQGPVLLPARASTREHFARVMFPLGELTKAEVRALAREAGLPVFDKPDSTGICFIGERPFREFLARYIPTTPGDIVTERGDGRRPPPRPRVLHAGPARRPRDRRPRRRSARTPGTSPPRISRATNCIAVQGHDHPLLVSRALATGPCNWLVQPDAPEFASQIKVRYRQADQACHATVRARWRARSPLRGAAARRDARAIRGAVRRRSLPRRRRHRAHDGRNNSALS